MGGLVHWISKASRLRLCALALLCAIASHALAAPGPEPYPSRPLHLVVPFAPGSGGDFLARLVGNRLAAALGQPVLIENRAGAAGNLAMEYVAKKPPDGYTLILGNAGTNTINPTVYSKLQFDPIRSFAPISKLTTVPSVIVAGPGASVRSLPELVEQARNEPGNLDYATVGIGLSSHLAMAAFSERARIELRHIPYGSGGVLKAVLAGEVPFACSAIEVVRASIESGRLQALAVTGERRLAALPDTPTIAEFGYPGFSMVSWYGVLAPSGTPVKIVDRLNAELVRIVRDPEIAKRIADAGQVVVGGTVEEFAADIRTDLARGRRMVEALRIRVD